MKRVFLTACLVLAFWGSTVEATEDADKILDHDEGNEFKKFKTRFGRNCTEGTEHCKKRKRNFKAHLKKLKQWNAEAKGGAVYGVNRFSDLSIEEKRRMVMSRDSTPSVSPSQSWENNVWPTSDNVTARKARATVRNYDVRTMAILMPARDQGECGSCWAFAAVAALEGTANIANHRNGSRRVSYSEQFLLDCTSGGCDGGRPTSALKYIRDNGIVRAAALKYRGMKNPTCTKKGVEYPIASVVTLTGRVNDIISHVKNVGPVVACFHTCDDIYSYWRGIMTTNCKPTDRDYVAPHCATIVGYGTENNMDYWTIRNSWGLDWGENGHGQIVRGRDLSTFESRENVGITANLIH